MLIGWLGVTIAFFRRMAPARAAAAAVVGGVLLLPMASYDLQGLMAYDKAAAVALGLLLSGAVRPPHAHRPLRFLPADIPMVLWCVVSPIATSLSNGLGWYEAFGSVVVHNLIWGVVYWTGRSLFSDPASSEELCRAILAGGVLYVPLCLFEVRMSPQLSNIVYGFFPHSFLQHFRYGGYRPLVFMQHGLMVSLWMAESFVVAFWLWRSRVVTRFAGVPQGLIVLALFVTTILCKSANGWAFMVLGLLCFLYYRRRHSTLLLRLLILLVPAYIVVRATGLVSIDQMLALAQRVFDPHRVESLSMRLVQENLFGARAFERLLFGWGGWGRSWPVDPVTGERVLAAVDSLFVITFGTNGLFGLVTLFAGILAGPWRVLRPNLAAADPGHAAAFEAHGTEIVFLGIVVTFFAIDALLNSMINQVYVLCTGALVSYSAGLRPARSFAPAGNDMRPLPSGSAPS